MWTLMIILLLSLLSSAFAQTVGIPSTESLNQFTASLIISGSLSILLGGLILFFGYRLLKPLLFIAGFYVFCIMGFAILTRAGVESADVLLWGSIGFGVLGGLLAIFFYKLGIALLGALGGITLALWILSMKAGGLLPDQTQRTIFIIVFAVIGSIVIHFAEKPAIILASSFSGAYSVCYGIDTFTHIGYAAHMQTYFNTQNFKLNPIDPDQITWQLGLLIAANLLLFIIGAVVQFRMNKDRHHNKV